MKWILVATDGSESAKAAERRGAELAEKLGEGLALAYVVEPPMGPPEGVFPIDDLVRDQQTWAHRFLIEEARELARPNLEVSTQVGIGVPAKVVAALAANEEIDFVVIGSRGRGAVARLLLGSVANRLSHSCPKPLLIVPPPRASSTGAGASPPH